MLINFVKIRMGYHRHLSPFHIQTCWISFSYSSSSSSYYYYYWRGWGVKLWRTYSGEQKGKERNNLLMKNFTRSSQYIVQIKGTGLPRLWSKKKSSSSNQLQQSQVRINKLICNQINLINNILKASRKSIPVVFGKFHLIPSKNKELRVRCVVR